MADPDVCMKAINQAIKALSDSEKNKANRIPSLLVADGNTLITSVEFDTVWRSRIKRYFANAGLPGMIDFLEACYNKDDKRIQTFGDVPQSI